VEMKVRAESESSLLPLENAPVLIGEKVRALYDPLK